MKEQVRAVDIVLVPPVEVQDFAIDLSSQLNGSTFVLGKHDFVPHITLCMGFTNDVRKISSRIEKILEGQTDLKLEIKDLRRESASLILNKTSSLMSLHSRILRGVGMRYLDKVQGAYVDGEARPQAVEYIKSFKSEHSGENYNPHITIGDGDLANGVQVTLPKNFKAKMVALFHLGDYNTCRKLLGKWSLGE